MAGGGAWTSASRSSEAPVGPPRLGGEVLAFRLLGRGVF
jgi:hypothetical protein